MEAGRYPETSNCSAIAKQLEGEILQARDAPALIGVLNKVLASSMRTTESMQTELTTEEALALTELKKLALNKVD